MHTSFGTFWLLMVTYVTFRSPCSDFGLIDLDVASPQEKKDAQFGEERKEHEMLGEATLLIKLAAAREQRRDKIPSSMCSQQPTAADTVQANGRDKSPSQPDPTDFNLTLKVLQ